MKSKFMKEDYIYYLLKVFNALATNSSKKILKNHNFHREFQKNFGFIWKKPQ